MGWLWNEIKYTMKMRKHLFFLLVIMLGIASAMFLFNNSLKETLEKAFPGDYGKTTTEASMYRMEGTYDDKTAANDIDIKAEIQFNGQLHGQDWMEYREIVDAPLLVKNFKGTGNSNYDAAVIGKSSDEINKNKSVTYNNNKYGKVKSLWMDEETAAEMKLGDKIDEIFHRENDYLDTIYVVLGAGYKMPTNADIEGDAAKKTYYSVDDTMDIMIDGNQMKAVVIGFLQPGMMAAVGSENINLNYYIICPLLDLSHIYDEKKEENPVSGTEPFYLRKQQIKEEAQSCLDTNIDMPTKTEGSDEYAACKTLSICEDDINRMTEVPEWLTQLKQAKTGTGGRNIAAGTKYKFSLGQNFDVLTRYGEKARLVYIREIPQESTLELNGTVYNLDEYIVTVLLNPVSESEEPEGTEGTTETGDKKSEENSDGKKEENADGVKLVTYDAGQRGILFRMLVMKNSCYVKAAMSADEAQRKLENVIETTWSNYKTDNKDLQVSSSYCIKDADKPGSIVYREGIRKVPEKLEFWYKVTYWALLILIGAYFVRKFQRGTYYYTSIYMSGDSKPRIMFLFLTEAILMYALASGIGFFLAWIIGKLLNMELMNWKDPFNRNFLYVFIPFAVVSVLVGIKDFGKIFRRR